MEIKDISAIKKTLLETAEALFSEKGYNGTSIREIAKGVDVNLALVNYHFVSKDNLYLAIFQRRFLVYEKTLLKMKQKQEPLKNWTASLKFIALS